MKKPLLISVFLTVVVYSFLFISCSSVKSAREDYYALWMDALKGGNGPVYYVGNDETNSYFRVGYFIHAYYKIRAVDAHLPKTFPVSNSDSYQITFSMVPENKPQ
jgi:hypothetical protein